MSTIANTAMTFAISRIVKRFKKVENTKMPFIAGARNAMAINTTIEAAHVLATVFRWCAIEEREGRNKPRASFVVAVKPTMELTSPTVSPNAG